MRSAFRKILVCSLLATYGAVALLGQGLHWLSAVDHHHHGLTVAHCHEHGAGHSHSQAHSHSHGHGHGHGHHHVHVAADACTADHDTALVVRSSEGITLCGECDICAFLSQSKCERPQIAEAEIWQHAISAIPAALQRTYSPIALGLPSPRGPPISLA